MNNIPAYNCPFCNKILKTEYGEFYAHVLSRKGNFIERWCMNDLCIEKYAFYSLYEELEPNKLIYFSNSLFIYDEDPDFYVNIWVYIFSNEVDIAINPYRSNDLIKLDYIPELDFPHLKKFKSDIRTWLVFQ